MDFDFENKEDFIQYLNDQKYKFLLNIKDQYFFGKVIKNEIFFISFQNWKFPMYQNIYIDDIIKFKIYSDGFVITLKNSKMPIGDNYESNQASEHIEFLKCSLRLNEMINKYKNSSIHQSL